MVGSLGDGHGGAVRRGDKGAAGSRRGWRHTPRRYPRRVVADHRRIPRANTRDAVGGAWTPTVKGAVFDEWVMAADTLDASIRMQTVMAETMVPFSIDAQPVRR